MDYRVSPFGDIWKNGIFNVPNELVDRYIKMASEYQLKALLFILRNGGCSDSSSIARALGQTASDIDELLEFWVNEGVIVANGQEAVTKAPVEQSPDKKETEKPAVKEVISAPRLTPKDIVAYLRDDENLRFLLSDAQRVLGRTISHSEQEMLVNMVIYYGLKVEVVLMILEFYRSEKEKGKTIGISYINSMAKNWAEEGISSIADAEQKLQDIARGNRLWNEVVAITGIRHRQPTAKQREMVDIWFKDFDIAMITLAADIMKENTPQPTLAYVNKILKEWKKKGISSPAQVQAEQEAFAKSREDKQGKKADRLKGKPSYDLEQIKRDAMDNTEI